MPKVGGAILGPGDLSTMDINLSGALKLSYSQNFFFAYLNEGPFLTQSLTHLSSQHIVVDDSTSLPSMNFCCMKFIMTVVAACTASSKMLLFQGVVCVDRIAVMLAPGSG